MAENKKNTAEQKLLNLYSLQLTDSEIDKIQTLRGELPEQVSDLENEIEELNRKKEKVDAEVSELKKQITDRQNAIKEAEAKIEKYEKQQSNVKNNREFDSLSKEIEYQTLEVDYCNKQIREYKVKIAENNDRIVAFSEQIEEKNEDLKAKKGELDNIVGETEKEEKSLLKKSEKLEKEIDERLLAIYKSIRSNVKNKLAVVALDREACGGCFSKVPPQRRIDVAARKSIIVCEHCGRILVDAAMKEELK